MTFFYDLNKKLDSIREKPETTHKRLDERAIAEKISPPIKTNPAERGKYTGKDIGDLKSMKAANLKKTAGYRERGEKVPDELKGKTAELNFALRAKQAHGGKWGKIKESDLAENMTDDKTAAQQALQALGQGNNQDMIKDLQRRAGVPQTGKVQPGQQPMAEDDMEEGNKFTGNLMKARAAGKKQADLDGDGDMEPVREEDMGEGIEDRIGDLDMTNPVNQPAYQRKAAAQGGAAPGTKSAIGKRHEGFPRFSGGQKPADMPKSHEGFPRYSGGGGYTGKGTAPAQKPGALDEVAPKALQKAGDVAGQVVGGALAGALAAIPGIAIGGATLGPGGAVGAGAALGLAGAKAGADVGGHLGRQATNKAYDSVVNLWRKASAKLGGPEATAEFVKAHATAADYSRPDFEFGGKKYSVTMNRAQARQAMRELSNVAQTMGESGTPMTAKQKKIDMNKNGKLDANDFEMLRKGGKQETDEATNTGNAGDTIRQIYQQFYDKGDDALDYLHDRAENFARYWDRFEGDLDSMIAELPPKILARLARELQGLADQEGITEGWDDMVKDAERRRMQMKTGEKTQGHKGEIEKTDTGIRHTRRYDAKTGETDTGDDTAASGEKRGRGRPKKTDRQPERVTAKAYKHKGGRKMSKEDIEEAISALEGHGYSVSKLEEKAVSQQQQKFMGMVHSMQKGEKVKGASPELKKVAKTMKPKDAEDFASTRHKGLPKKKTEEVEETTVAGSVAPATETPKSKGKGGMTFGKGIYDSLNRELETMIAESMNVSVNMSMDEHGEPHKDITVSAQGEEAEQLAQLLNLAGIAAKTQDHGTCPTCGETDCGCEQMVDENAPDWPTNTEVTGDDDPHLTRWAGGLNKPKETGQTTAPVVNRDPARGSYGPMAVKNGVNETTDLGMKLYHELQQFKG
jgi:hypothetical protein